MNQETIDLKMYTLLHILKEESQCIDKQVACIIADDQGTVRSYGVNTIIVCNKNCHDKKNRICEVIHAEIKAIEHLCYTGEMIDTPLTAYLSLFPCVPCQKALTSYVNEIRVFGPKHKGQVFDNIVLMPDYGQELIAYNGKEKQLSIVQGELSELISAIGEYLYRPEKNVDTWEVMKEIVDVELQLHLLKWILWSDNHESFNELRETRYNKLYNVFDKLKSGLL